MNKKLTWFSLVTVFVFLTAGVFASSALAQTGTTLVVNPTPAEARTCSTSTVSVRVQDVTNLTAFHLELSFDASKIEVTAVAPGSFLIGEGETYLPEITNAVDNSLGTVVWGLAKQGTDGNPNPATGSGDLLVLTVKAKVANASSALTIDGAKSMLVDWPEAQAIAFTDTDGVINTKSCAPTDIALSNASVAENQPSGTTVGSLSATDPDSADTSFTYAFADLTGHPDAMYFSIDGSTLKTNVPFDFETKASYSIRLKVTDPWGETYDENFTITVTDVNDAPVLGYVGDKSVDELSALTFNATATDADLPAQTLTFSLADGTTGAIPAGASIDPSTGAFTWTPTEAQGPGAYTFDVCVSDGALSDCETITVTVNEVNVAPVLGPIGNKDIEELVPFTFTASASDVDIPAQTLAFSLAAGTSGAVPEGAAINAATGVFTWTPSEAQGDGTFTFDVCVSDGALSDCETITINVYEDMQVTALDLLSATTPTGPWTAVPGSYAEGFVMQLDPAVEYYYLDTNTIISNRPLADGVYPFSLSSAPAGFMDYWAARGVVAGATGWQGAMWQIINGDAPFFYLKVEGTSYTLLDGLQYALGNTTEVLRVNGTYLLGDYSFSGSVADSNGFSDSLTVDISFVGLLDVTDLDLWSATTPTGPWTAVPGSYAEGFVMQLDPAVEYYYLDTNSITSNRPLANGVYPFSLTSAPAGFMDYWAARGVVDGATGWQGAMWQIINGDAPFFYLKVEGTSYTLLDGLQYALGNTTEVLRVNGTYLLGDYSFSGSVADSNGFSDTLNVDISFVSLLDLTDAQLQYSVDQSAWTDLTGSFTAGYSMLLDTSVEYYYLNTPSVTVNRPLAAGLHPFFVESYPTDFFDYWAAKGVVAGASGWQGVMWDIINGNAPIFYLKVSAGPTYQLVDGLTYQLGGVESYLKINGSYLPGAYSFSGVVTDEYGYTDQAEVDILFNDIPVAEAQSVSTAEDTGIDITLSAVDLYPGSLTWEIVSQPAHGTLSGTAPDITYTPALDYVGTDSFSFRVNDGTSDSNIALVTITITGVNDAPALSPIGDQSADEGVELSFTAVGTDVDGDALTYSLVGAPEGASIDPATGAFTWTPTEAQGPGTYTFDVCVSDGTLTQCETITVTIGEVNVAPVLGLIGNQTIAEEAELSLTATATDADVPANTLTFSLVGAPEGASIDPATGAFTWTPTEAQGPDEYTFTVKVCDNGTPVLCDEESITVTVTEVNVAPVLGAIGDKSVAELVQLSFTATATDADLPANTLTFSLVGAPTGASIDPATGAFTWTPTEAQGPGTYTFDVCVSDGTLTVCETITVTIGEVNVAPVLGAIGDKTVAEETALSFTATATDADLPANTLTFSLVGAPEGASINPATGAFTWTPTEAQGPGEFTFTVKVCDSGDPVLCDEEEITVTVSEVNIAPVAVDNSYSTLKNQVLNITAPGVLGNDSDADLPANTLTAVLVADIPAGEGTLVLASSGAFSYTPPVGFTGQTSFTYKVYDGALYSGVATVTITVTESNLAPTDIMLTDQTILENLPVGSITAYLSAVDPNVGDSFTYSLVSGAGDTDNSAFSITGNQLLSAQVFDYETKDSYSIRIRVTDQGGLRYEESFVISILDVNDAPVANNQTVSTPEDTALAILLTGSDQDGDPLTYAVIANPTHGILTGTAPNLTYTPAANYYGPDSFTFQASDAFLVSNIATVTINVQSVNDAPVLGAIGSKSVAELVELSFTATAVDLDLPPDTLTFSLVGAPEGASIDPATGAFSWTPTEAQGPDEFTFTVKVCDSGTPVLCDEESITVTVTEVNVAPVLGAIGDKSVAEETALSFTATATDADVPANTLIFSLVGAPEGASIDPATGAFTWPPTEAQGPGEYTFTVKVCDNGTPSLCDEESITVTVTEVNVAPVLGAIGDKSVAEETALSFTATATDADLPANTLTFSLVGAPEGASIDPATGAFTWTPTEAQGPGEYTFTVKVCDNGTPSLCDEESITVTVTEVNVAPVLGAIGDKTVAEETELSFTALATDADLPANTLTFSLVGAPTGASIDPATGAFTWTPTEAQGPGEYTFTVKVCDNGTPVLCDEQEITVTVSEVNVAPVLGAIGDKSVAEETALSFTATATDADVPANTLAFSLVGAPAGASINPTTGAFTWTPTEAQGPGEYTFTVKVCDNGTPVLCDEESITVTVTEVNTAPTAQDQEVTTPEDTPVDITLVASDPEEDPLTVIIVDQPLHGDLTINGLVVTYTPDLNYYGGDSFTYKVNDGLVDSNTATVTITITPVNDAPVAYGMTVETLENFPVDITLLATDPEGDIGTFIIVSGPAYGTLECDGRYCTYTPDPNWNGEDSFIYKVNDGQLDSNEAVVSIIVYQGPRIYIPILFK